MTGVSDILSDSRPVGNKIARKVAGEILMENPKTVSGGARDSGTSSSLREQKHRFLRNLKNRYYHD